MLPVTWAPRTLAILRIVAGLLFLEHALMKFFGFPAPAPSIPHPLPAMIVAAGAIELVTGILLTLGLFARISAFVAAGEMAVAYWIAHAPQGAWPALNMGEPALLFCFIFLHIAAAGGGAWSLDGARNVRTNPDRGSGLPTTGVGMD